MSARDRGSSRRQSTSHRRSSRRKDKQKKHHLTQEDIDYIKKNTRYDESEIREWYKGFKVRFDQKYFNLRTSHQNVPKYRFMFSIYPSLNILLHILIGGLPKWSALKRQNNGDVYNDFASR